jgi:uncharacterized membrane protein YphA (DoxX/SURF4 family)
MTTQQKHQILTYLIATVWLINGLICKVLNLVPRHEQIVGSILGEQHAHIFTTLIGFAEIAMAVWVLLGIFSRFNAIAQIVIVLVMNVIEFTLVPDLLLWGKMNILFAALFALLVYYNEFHLNPYPRSFLQNHPFAVEAFFDSSLVFTFAVPKEQLQGIIPQCLQLDTFKDQYAFIAVAMVQTKGLRPKGLPKWLGNNFFLIGYRVFVRYTNSQGKNLRGLYILKSETDKKKMEFLGNVFTHYHYTTTDITQTATDSYVEIKSKKSGFYAKINDKEAQISLPQSSPFADWKEARRFAGPLPFTFTYLADKQQVVIIEGVRENWTPAPVRVEDCHFAFLQSLPIQNPILANAFIIKNIPYHWKKGKVETWKPQENPSKV